jgi:Holliday junction resolvase
VRLMNELKKLKRSSKVIGKYERPLIRIITKYYESKSFIVFPHTRFNVAWSNVLSDVDILMLKDGYVFVVEVKSHRDNIYRAYKQINRLRDFIDYIYVATDKPVHKWKHNEIGLLFVDVTSETIKEINSPPKLHNKPSLQTIGSFPRKCLTRTLSVTVSPQNYQTLYKYQLAELLMRNSRPGLLRTNLKEIATCELDCDGECPIWNFKRESGYDSVDRHSKK